MSAVTIKIVGDSHVIAFKSAVKLKLFRPPQGVSFTILRLTNDKKVSIGGDASIEKVIDDALTDDAPKILVIALRGNQFNTLGLMQHPLAFDLMREERRADAELVPIAVFRAFFDDTLRKGYGRILEKLSLPGRSIIYCLAPPAPKEDADHILRNAETFFRDGGIAEIGISPAPLRLKLWTLQNEALEYFCNGLGIRFLWNPDGTRDEAGYLRREFYANDATHGNAAYGALVLQQIFAQLPPPLRNLTEGEPR